MLDFDHTLIIQMVKYVAEKISTIISSTYKKFLINHSHHCKKFVK